MNSVQDNHTSLIDRLRTLKEEKNEILNKKIQFVRDDIEVTIESLENELQKLRVRLNNELDLQQEKIKNDFIEPIDVEYYETRCKELRSNELIKEVQCIKNLIEKYSQKEYTIQLKITHNLSEYFNSIGEIQLKTTIKDQIRSRKFRILDFDTEANDVCILSNGNFLVVNFDFKWSLLYDSSYNIIKTIDRINGQTFQTLSVATDGSNHVYFSDLNNNRIIMTNLNIEFVKYSSVEINSPRGIFFKKNHLYVCDFVNKQIHRFNANLEDHCSFNVEYGPTQIKIADKVACVKHGLASISFYNLQDFALIRRYRCHGGNIVALSTNEFIEYSSRRKLFSFYDSNCDLVEEHVNEEISELVADGYNGMIVHDGQLLMTSTSSKCLILI